MKKVVIIVVSVLVLWTIALWIISRRFRREPTDQKTEYLDSLKQSQETRKENADSKNKYLELSQQSEDLFYRFDFMPANELDSARAKYRRERLEEIRADANR